MCCGQKRAALTTPLSPTPRTIPNVGRGTSVERGSFTAHTSAAPQRAGRDSSSAPSTAPAVEPADSPALDDTSVYLQYRDQSQMRVRGLATGRVYEFSGSQPVQAVNQRDAAALLQTRLFRRA